MVCDGASEIPELGVVLVTGGASDIGWAIGARLRGHGAQVVLADIASDDEVVPLDITQRASVEEIFDLVWERHGALDGLVNCATVGGTIPLLELTDDAWDRTVDVTLRGTWLCAQAFARRNAERGRGGAIVNVSSTAATRARPGVAHYAAAKAGVNQFTRVAALELAPLGIRVNTVCPGLIDTRAVRGFAQTSPREHETKVASIPMGRMGRPDEIASVVEFLLGDGASFMTGSTVFVDGGYSSGLAKY